MGENEFSPGEVREIGREAFLDALDSEAFRSLIREPITEAIVESIGERITEAIAGDEPPPPDPNSTGRVRPASGGVARLWPG